MSASIYPVHVKAHIDPRLSRWQWLFKWLLVLPHYVVLAFLWVAFVVLSFVAFFAILFTGRYPRSIFDFNVGVLRWTWRVAYYAYGALGTDRYPPFSLAERADYPAHLEIDYPERLSRGLVLVKWWLLAIPHYLIVSLFLGGAGYALDGAARRDGGPESGTGLIGLLVLVAAVVLLVTGRYPRPIYDLVLGLNRWVLRVAAYAALMTDVYPPFRLDQGDDDPGTRVARGELAWPVDSAAPPRAVVPAPTTQGARHPWTAGRVVAMVAGCVMLLGSVGIGLGGIVLGYADHSLRDRDGYLMSHAQRLSTSTYAIASSSITINADARHAGLPERLLGDVKVTATGTAAPVFVGIAPTADVRTYLRGVQYATVTDLAGGPSYSTTGGSRQPSPPATSTIWVAQSTGTGNRAVVWPAANGDWTLVVMNADGSAGVTSSVAAGATVPALDWLVPLLLALAAMGLVVSSVLVVAALQVGSGPEAPTPA